MHKTILRSWFSSFLVAIAFALPVGAADSVKALRALLVCGGCCHDYTNQKRILSEGISARAYVEFTIVQEGNDRTNRVSIYEKPDWWKGYDIIVHNECFGMVNDDKFIENITAAHATGVPGPVQGFAVCAGSPPL